MNDAVRWVVVTGAGGGIGAACTRALARNGFRVVAASRQGNPISADRERGPAPAMSLALDITSDESIASAVTQIDRAVGDAGLYAVVNCAGITSSGPLESCTRGELLHLFDVNVAGPMAVSRAVLPLLRRGRGRIVNIGSTSGEIPGSFSGAYCGTKFALDAMHDVLRAELSKSGVPVSLIVPGVVATPFWDKAGVSQRQARERLLGSGVKHYDSALTRRQAMFDALSKSGLPPEAVADVVIEALIALKPRSRFMVGRDARWKLALWRLLPDILRERVIKRGL